MMLSTDIWVAALIRRVELGGGFAVVARKGDARAGAVLVKVLDRRNGVARLYAEATRGDGETRGPIVDGAVQRLIGRQSAGCGGPVEPGLDPRLGPGGGGQDGLDGVGTFDLARLDGDGGGQGSEQGLEAHRASPTLGLERVLRTA